MANDPIIARFNYKNHRGELSYREVLVDSLEWLSNPGYGYQPGWFLSGTDTVKGERRSFAVTHMVLPVKKPNAYAVFQIINKE